MNDKYLIYARFLISIAEDEARRLGSISRADGLAAAIRIIDKLSHEDIPSKKDILEFIESYRKAHDT